MPGGVLEALDGPDGVRVSGSESVAAGIEAVGDGAADRAGGEDEEEHCGECSAGAGADQGGE